ncbi:MAG: aldo/keto reductase [Oscillospiraceae bacterium]|nr:aldo/keto reductase [Oscillospiraceae bacterium]
MGSSIDFNKIGKLGFGYMRLPKKGDGFDYDQINKMADTFLENGGTYFDAAYVYTGAEEALRETVVKRHPRNSFQIATKIPIGMINKDRPKEHFIEESLKRLGTDYIDFYLLHGINKGASKEAEEKGVWDYLKELKSKGIIRHIAFSFHGHPEDLNEILSRHPETEMVMPQLNYDDWDKPKVQAKRIYEILREYNTPIVAMEPLLGGKLASTDSPIADIFKAVNPDASVASWALRFIAELEGIFVTLSGMSTYEQVTDNIKTFSDLKPLSNDEKSKIQEAVKALRAMPRIECTSCDYCKDCPENIPIPNLIHLYNDHLIHKTTTNFEGSYGWMTGGRGKAKDCTSCAACEKICPQNLEIIDTMKKVSKLFD